jgi:hypothetical protein
MPEVSMPRMWKATALVLLSAATAIVAPDSGLAAGVQSSAPAAASDRLILYGDMVTFYGRGKTNNCILQSRYKRGEPVGFRMFAADPATGKREPSAELVVHITYGGQTVDVPMRYRATVKEPQFDFYVAKWVVPENAPIGMIRYTVTAKDQKGRTGEFKPFDNDLSQLTIVEGTFVAP